MPVLTIERFAQPSYLTQNDIVTQTCKNLYPCVTPDGWALKSTAGLSLLGAVANNKGCRGAVAEPSGMIYSVHDDKVYRINSNGTSTEIGTVSNLGLRDAYLAIGNGNVLVTVGAKLYSITGVTLTEVTDANAPEFPIGLAYFDGRYVTMNDSTATFYLSQLNSGTNWTPATFATAESDGDPGWGPVKVGDKVLIFGYNSIEPWYNTGASGFPWERISGGVIPFGIPDIDVVAELNSVVYFIGQGKGGVGSVWSYSDAGLKKLSTPIVEANISKWSFQNAYGYAYNYQGKAFYEIYCNDDTVTTQRCWVYNADDNAWFTRETNSTIPTIRTVLAAHNSLFALDRDNGNIYSFGGANDDNGTAISRVRAFGPIQAGASRMFHHRIRFVLEIDHDSSSTYTLSGSLDWSDDGGATWSTARTLSKAITSGTTAQRVMLEAYRLGSSRQRYYRLTLAGPSARIVLQSAELEYDIGRN